MDAWRDIDVSAEVAAFGDWPVYLQNDATAACGAELAFGAGGDIPDFLYLYVGTFIGGGIVLNGNLYPGRTGNAGAFGPMPVPGPDGRMVELIDRASLVGLEAALTERGLDAAMVYAEEADWSGFADLAEAWLDDAAPALAHAVIASATVVDFEAAIIDGSLPPDLRTDLVRRVEIEVARLERVSIRAPRIVEGTLGAVARALGGASLPLFDGYLIDQHALMRAP